MFKKVFSFREQLLHFTDVFRFNLRFDEVPKSALFIQINQDLQTGSGKGVNRNRITIREIDTDRGFNLSARSFEFGDFDFGRFNLVGAIVPAITLFRLVILPTKWLANFPSTRQIF